MGVGTTFGRRIAFYVVYWSLSLHTHARFIISFFQFPAIVVKHQKAVIAFSGNSLIPHSLLEECWRNPTLYASITFNSQVSTQAPRHITTQKSSRGVNATLAVDKPWCLLDIWNLYHIPPAQFKLLDAFYI